MTMRSHSLSLMRTWEQNVDNRHLHVMRERGAETPTATHSTKQERAP